MRSFTIFLAALFLLQTASAMRFTGYRRCAQSCRFTLCRRSVVSMGLPYDRAQTSAICLRGRRVGIVNSGEALVRTRKSFVRISKVSPRGLKQSYTPHFFKTFAINKERFSGIGHETPQQNQAGFLNNRCIALPVQEYQVLGKMGNRTVVVDNKKLSRKFPLKNCVSFRVKAVRK